LFTLWLNMLATTRNNKQCIQTGGHYEKKPVDVCQLLHNNFVSCAAATVHSPQKALLFWVCRRDNDLMQILNRLLLGKWWKRGQANKWSAASSC
jgi:hypothetical protein